jgi:hypothetical protein
MTTDLIGPPIESALGLRIADLERTEAKYQELLFAVARKFPGETRHETALRYILEAEAAVKVGAGCTAAMGSNAQAKGPGGFFPGPA